VDRSFYRFVTKHACDRQTDGRTDRILLTLPRLHYMQRGKNAEKLLKKCRGIPNPNTDPNANPMHPNSKDHQQPYRQDPLYDARCVSH